MDKNNHEDTKGNLFLRILDLRALRAFVVAFLREFSANGRIATKC